MTLIGIKGNVSLQGETNGLRKRKINILMEMLFRICWKVFNSIITAFTKFTKFKLVKQWVDFSSLEK